MVSVVQNVAIDCENAYELARFWSRVTGRPLHPEGKPGDHETQVLLAEGPVLHFNQVPESKKIKTGSICVCALRPRVSRRWNGCWASAPPLSPITGIPMALAGQSLPTPKATSSAFFAASPTEPR